MKHVLHSEASAVKYHVALKKKKKNWQLNMNLTTIRDEI